MGNGMRRSPHEHQDADQRLSRHVDRRHQLARTLQWDADGKHLLRAAAFHGVVVAVRFYRGWGQ